MEAASINTKPLQSSERLDLPGNKHTHWSLHTGLMHNWHLKYNSNQASGGLSSNSGGEDFVTPNFIFIKML